MPDPLDNDLFEETKMTFGEHLEELRSCLWKAVAGLALGVIVGLVGGKSIVNFIQSPISDALEIYYTSRTLTQFDNWVEKNGDHPVFSRKELDRRIKEDDLIFDFVQWDLAQLRHLVATTAGDEKSKDPKNQDDHRWRTTKTDLVPVLLFRPIEDDDRISTKAFGAQEAFVIWLKAGFVGGVVLSSPWVFYQIWIFVAAGLYPHEQKYVYVFLPFSLALFLAGAALAFFAVFHFVLKFLFDFNVAMGINPEMRISEWLSFALFLPIGFGISFQLPLVMLFLERIGIFTVDHYVDKWRVAILVIAVISMLLTPADPMSMMLMFIPLTVLFFLGIGLCKYMKKSGSPFDAE